MPSLTESFDQRLEVIDDAARHVIVSVNPKAGARSGDALVQQLVEALEARQLTVSVVHEVEQLQAETASHLRDQSLRAVVCAGGDGTVAFVANSVPPEAPLAILPLGTENLLAKYLGIAPQADEIADLIAAGHAFRFDAGLARDASNDEGSDGKSPGRIFTLMAGVGFDADVVKQVHQGRTGHIHHWSYAKPILSTIRTYKYPAVFITTDTGQSSHAGHSSEARWDDQKLKARWVFIANLPRYARNLRIVPDACGWNGKLTICTFKKGSLWMGLQYLAAIFFRRHRSWTSDVRMVEATRIRLEAVQPVSYQLDGDYGGELPLELEVLPARLRMLVPAAWIEQESIN